MRLLVATVIGLFAIILQQDQTAIQGRWAVMEYDQNGQKPDPAILKKMQVVIGAEKMTIRPRLVAEYRPVLKGGKTEKEVVFSIDEGKADEMRFRLTPDKGWIDLGEGKITKGVYSLEGDTLRICFSANEKMNRLKKIPDQPKNGVVRMVLKRVVEK